MSNLYGFFGDAVYRMSTKTNVSPKVIDVFSSTTYIKENTADRSITNCVRINTMDFFKDETNETLYAKLLDFLKKSKVTGINTLYYSLKIGLDYQICDMNGSVIDGGIRYIQTDADEVNVLLDPDPITYALPYRRAEYVNKKFAISRITGSTYGVMDAIPKGVTFKINAVLIYANLTDTGSQYYIQNLGPSAQDTTFAYGSGTINSINFHSVVLFDSTRFGITFPVQRLNYMPNTIYVDVEALLNQFCYISDDSALWEIVEANGGMESDAPSEFFDNSMCPGGSPFEPVVDRKPCHGNYPMPPCKPRPPKPPKPPVNGGGSLCPPPSILPPSSGGSGNGPTPIVPGGGWNPDDTIVPEPDYNQDHGDVNIEEWCIAPDYIADNLKFTVVADDIDDSEFDATCMVKISEVSPYISDVQIGDKVRKMTVMYY